MLGKLRRFLGESFHQGLAKAKGRLVDINELTIGRVRICWGRSGGSLVSLPPGSGKSEGEDG
jgi:hypothetical protein